MWDAIARCVNSRCSECRLAPENIEFEKYISCHCFYLKTKFQINWAGGRVLGKWGALQACWRRSANAIWLQSCYFIVWLRCMRRKNILLSSREFVLRTFLHCKIFANRSMIYLEHDFFALLSHMCVLDFCHTGQAAPRKVLSAYKSDGAYCNCANTWAHCISMYWLIGCIGLFGDPDEPCNYDDCISGKQSACKSSLRLRKERQSMEQQLSQYKHQLHKTQALLCFRILLQVLGWFLHSSFWTHVWSWQETVPTHCEQEMQMLPGCSISQRPFSFNKCCGTDSACESWSTSYRRRESSSAWVETWFSCKVEKRTPEHGWAAITFQAAALPCSGHAAFSLIDIPFGHREFCYSCHVVDALEGMWSSKLLDL